MELNKLLNYKVKSAVFSRIEKEDFNIKDFDMGYIYLYGSRVNGNHEANSDLDVLVGYYGDMKEDVAFELLNEDSLTIEGVRIDFNPINLDRRSVVKPFDYKGRVVSLFVSSYYVENITSRFGVKVISSYEYQKMLLPKLSDRSFKREELKSFLVENNGIFTAIDNHDRELFTEDFPTLEKAVLWLADPSLDYLFVYEMEDEEVENRLLEKAKRRKVLS